mgnify:CR=1 FL=1
MRPTRVLETAIYGDDLDAMLAALPDSGGRSSTRAKIMRPAPVVSELVTTVETDSPMCADPPSTTTIVPSER